MKGITFGDYHSFYDLHLILTRKEIGSPAVKVKKVEVEGADSDLDLTDYFGEQKYENVIHRFYFSSLFPRTESLSLFSTIKNAIHGKKVRIILDDDPTFFYVGRCHVSSFTDEKGIGAISVECDCEPWKYNHLITIVSQSISGSGTVNLTNSRKRAVPEITTTASMTIAFGRYSVTTSAGTFTIPELELVEGVNTVTVTGTGTITFIWQEGVL